MALPESRDFTAVDTGALPAATVNNIQDMIIGGFHGSMVVQYPAQLWQPDVGGNATWDSGGFWKLNNTNAAVQLAINLPTGTRITKVQVYGKDTAIDEWTATLSELVLSTGGVGNSWGTADGAAVAPQAKSTGFAVGQTSVSWTSADTNMPFTMTAGEFYFINVGGTVGVNLDLYGAELTIEKAT